LISFVYAEIGWVRFGGIGGMFGKAKQYEFKVRYCKHWRLFIWLDEIRKVS